MNNRVPKNPKNALPPKTSTLLQKYAYQSSNYVHAFQMHGTQAFWFQGFQLGSNFIWNQPKIQKNLQKKNLVDWVAREAHGTHGGVRSHVGCSHVCCLSPTLSCKCYQHKF
jgi:hypothetical protein